jgi:hypothetical protein
MLKRFHVASLRVEKFGVILELLNRVYKPVVPAIEDKDNRFKKSMSNTSRHVRGIL